jgi:hypothetical protein
MEFFSLPPVSIEFSVPPVVSLLDWTRIFLSFMHYLPTPSLPAHSPITYTYSTAQIISTSPVSMPTLTPAMAHAYILSRTLQRNARSPALRLIEDVEKYMWCFLDEVNSCVTLLEEEQFNVLEQFITQTALARGCLGFRTPIYDVIYNVIRLWDKCFKALDDVTITPLQIVYFKKCSDSMLKLKVLMKDKDAGKESV